MKRVGYKQIYHITCKSIKILLKPLTGNRKTQIFTAHWIAKTLRERLGLPGFVRMQKRKIRSWSSAKYFHVVRG